jgi:tRNA(Ile)-lysidine synthase
MNPQELKKLENKVLEILKNSIPKKSAVVVGISGGPDSVFLLHMLQKLQKIQPIKIIIAHVNHLLRGKESLSDEKFVKDLAKACLPAGTAEKHIFHLLKKDVNKLSKTLKQGLEETGRKIRYEFFQELAKEYKAKLIITAHHADDNLETILMNFVRGAGVKGLAGMKELENLTKNLTLFRPLLQFSKQHILDYLKTKKIPYKIDKSNKNTIYTRNYIRHKIIPSLKKLNPNLAETTAKNTKNFREISHLVDTHAKAWIKKNSLKKNLKEFNIKTFHNESPALQKEIILQIYKTHIGNTQDIESPQVDEVLKIINSGLGNKRKQLQKLTFFIKNNILKVL